MKIGKISESILKRSVLKQIKGDRPEVRQGSSVGADCAVTELLDGENVVLSTDPVMGTISEVGRRAVHRTVNNVASAGAEPFGVLLSVLLPENVEEAELREMMQSIETDCEALNVQIMGGHTQVTRAVNEPVITATGVGRVKNGALFSAKRIKPGADIVVTKWVGLEGTYILANRKSEELKTYFAVPFIRNAQKFADYFSVVPEAKIAAANGAQAMHDISEGGVFGALWEIAEAGGVGLDIDLKAIPIKQETVEICNFFDINPYQLQSAGSLIIIAENGYDMVRELKDAGIPAEVIGKTTDGNDRTVRNGDEKRFLTRPEPDEIYRVLG
ncbi:Hydrogenase maturation factor [Lachnospiraceae bacterium]|nr:Hydrogenase maturation factor [Lachnospiraceae bacterium]